MDKRLDILYKRILYFDREENINKSGNVRKKLEELFKILDKPHFMDLLIYEHMCCYWYVFKDMSIAPSIIKEDLKKLKAEVKELEKIEEGIFLFQIYLARKSTDKKLAMKLLNELKEELRIYEKEIDRDIPSN